MGTCGYQEQRPPINKVHRSISRLRSFLDTISTTVLSLPTLAAIGLAKYKA